MLRQNDHIAPVLLLRWLFLALFSIGTVCSAQSQGHFHITPDLRKAYDLAFELRLDAARDVLTRSYENDPANLLNVFVEDYLDFFTLFVGENPSDYDRLKSNRDVRLKQLRTGNENSPYYLYTQAEVHLHWALVRFKFDEQFGAATEINRAFRLLKRNEKEFPDFAPNRKSIGMLRAGVGTIPDKYLWAVKLLSSLSGTIDEGMTDMRSAIDTWSTEYFPGREAHYFYVMASLHFANQPDMAWTHLNAQSWISPETNLSDCFVLGHVAMKTGRNDQAIKLYENRPKGNGTIDFAYLDFMHGLAKIFRNDSDADQPLLRFVRVYEGSNYIKEAFQKLAWHSWINGDPEKYDAYMDSCRTRGAAITDEDKHAMREAENGDKRHPVLLLSRLLFDGGYYARSLQQLDMLGEEMFDAAGRLELMYRKGRVYHALGRTEEALAFYNQTISYGSYEKEYFACNAALQAGLLHESMGNDAAALGMFEKCLDLNPSDYQASLHQKAKAGRNRIRGK